jgi:hypothetical protein
MGRAELTSVLSAVLAPPLPEGPEQRRIRPRAFDPGEADDARPMQVSQEEAGALEHVQTARRAVAGAAAATQVAPEPPRRRRRQPAHREALPIRPIEEVLRGAEVSAAGDLRIAGVGQGLGKPFNQRPRRTSTKGPNPRR